MIYRIAVSYIFELLGTCAHAKAGAGCRGNRHNSVAYSCGFAEGEEEEEEKLQRASCEVVKVTGAGASLGEWLGHSMLIIGIGCFLPR